MAKQLFHRSSRPAPQALTYTGDGDNNIFTGGPDGDTAYGNGGNDQLSGAGGDDILAGGDGADTIDGGDGSDTLFTGNYSSFGVGQILPPPVMDTGVEHDTVNGGAGSDRIFAGYGDDVDGGAQDSYWGDSLLISFLGASSGVTVDFRQASVIVGGGTITGIEGVQWAEGSNFNDDITLNDNPILAFAYLYGLGGNDRLVAGYYTRSIYGGDGNDTLDGTAGGYGPLLDGGAGDDTITSKWGSESELNGGTGNDILNSGGGLVRGGDGNDIITLQTTYYPAQHYADAGDDQMNGCSERDIFFGGAGADILRGNDGDDFLYSADGNYYFLDQQEDTGAEQDQLFGGSGNDRLVIGYGDSADGGIGTDTLVLSLTGASSGISLDTGALMAGPSFMLAGGVIQSIELLEGLKGTRFADTLTIATHGQLLSVDGGDGDDVISSSNSSVSVLGGNGNDRFVSGAAGDVFDGGAGTDTADYHGYANAVTVKLGLAAGSTGTGPGGDQLVNVENVDGSAFADTIWGSDQANILQGMGGADTLKGFGGNDTLIGGAGGDDMAGGSGNDTYIIDDAGDLVTEAAGEGSDIVYTALNFALAAGVEVEALSASDLNAAIALTLTGNEFGQQIFGNAGDNFLVAGGGADALYGGLGNDTYSVDTLDVVFDSGGNDIIYSSSNYQLNVGSQIEILSVNDLNATIAINLTGNEFGQSIYGNAGANFLIAGAGADGLYGGLGNDTYSVDTLDFVIDTGGFDTIYSSTNYALNAGAEIEILSANDFALTTPLNLTGNEFGQQIYGNAGDNFLIAGAGADGLYGKAGNDTYSIDSQDVVVEAAGEGFDTIYTSTSFALTAGNEVEVISVNDFAATTAINLMGNGSQQQIFGNAGANVLNGGGGADALIGNGGADTFAFATALGGGNIDSIGDFSSAAGDKVALDHAIFTALGAGALAASAFVAGPAALDADDRILYNGGQLFYDADGNGAEVAVLFATLSGTPALSASDFLII